MQAKTVRKAILAIQTSCTFAIPPIARNEQGRRAALPRFLADRLFDSSRMARVRSGMGAEGECGYYAHRAS
ncbi:hypothetical protein AA0616_0773 [Komagataeibacter nataicola NRIC 0616]|nr:hypothetical protein AA0616_0773 [Komagataeibacter nataicola NRIC 0616]